MIHTSMWTYYLCICMKFVPLYKNVILIGQGKYTSCTKCIQGCLLRKISINFEALILFFLSSKDCTLMSYIPLLRIYFMHFSSLIHDNSNTYLTNNIWGKILLLSFSLFFELNHWRHGLHIYVDILFMHVYGIYTTVQKCYTNYIRKMH